jgi:aspartate carbamoyltransferase regulatory subunit
MNTSPLMLIEIKLLINYPSDMKKLMKMPINACVTNKEEDAKQASYIFNNGTTADTSVFLVEFTYSRKSRDR